jgi:hypothetical protein
MLERQLLDDRSNAFAPPTDPPTGLVDVAPRHGQTLRCAVRDRRYVPRVSTIETAGAERIERRATWALAIATIVLVFPSIGFSLLGGPEAWNVALFVATQAALVLSVGAAALALVPRPGYVPGALRRRDPVELLFWAYALLWIGLLLTALNVSITAIDYLGDSDTGF